MQKVTLAAVARVASNSTSGSPRRRSRTGGDPMIALLARRALVVLPLVLAACSGDPGTSAPITKDISAANGGTVSDGDNRAVLTIPAGALAADTKITLTVSAKEADTATEIFAFGPAGTAFEIPVTLSIGTDGVSVPGGKKLVLGIQEG